jgi:sulfite reductase (NADPH) hemoprotein beta-component
MARRCGFALEPNGRLLFTSRRDYYWLGTKPRRACGIIRYLLKTGRVLDEENLLLKTALLEIAETGKPTLFLPATRT